MNPPVAQTQSAVSSYQRHLGQKRSESVPRAPLSPEQPPGTDRVSISSEARQLRDSKDDTGPF